MPEGFLRKPSLPSIKLTPEQQAEMDRNAREQQTKMPYWQRKTQELLEGVTSGLVGDEGNAAQESIFRRGAHAVGEILGGALPAPALMKKLGIQKLFHGTRDLRGVAEKGLDFTKHNRNDILGWMGHFAEQPTYAEQYAFGGMRSPEVAPGTIPAKIRGNVLDTFNPDPEDYARIASALPQHERAKFVRDIRAADNSDSKRYILSDYIDKMTPQQFERTGVDAVRYNDVGMKAWAISQPGSAINPYTNEPFSGLPPREFMARPRFIAGPEGIEAPAVREVVPEKLRENSQFTSAFDNPHFKKQYQMAAEEFAKVKPYIPPPEPEAVYHSKFGFLDKKEAKELVSGGELSMNWYEKNFPSINKRK